MRVAAQDYETITGGISQSGKMTIAMNGFAFASLINNLYSMKVDSPFRELLTNGRDGHAAVGKLDVPLQVQLPSHFDQTFWVRDFGCSMSHDFMIAAESGYRSLFSSTKRDTDEQVGMLGLGRVSPLAYTDAYTVTCWSEGMQRDYSVFLGADGVPDVAFLGSRPSDEPQGTKVCYPAKMEDVNRFRRAADKLMLGFEVLPEITNESYEPFENKVYKRGTNWRVYDDFALNPGLYARQGCVIYPISKTFLQDNLPSMPSYLRMIIDFPIGKLNVATSREELSYDTMTVDNLKVGIEATMAELLAEVEAEIQNAPDYFSACEMWMNMKGDYRATSNAIRVLIENRVKWKDYKLVESFPLDNQYNSTAAMYFDGDDSRVGNLPWALSFRQKSHGVNLAIATMKTVRVFVEYPDLKFGTARMKRVLSELCVKGERVLWMRPESKSAVELWRAAHGGMVVTDLATVEPLKTAATRKKTNAIRMRYVDANQTRVNSNALYEDVVLTNKSILMNQSGSSYDYFGNGRTTELDMVIQDLDRLVQQGVVPYGTRIYMVNGSNEKRVKAAVKNPVMAPDFIKDAIKKKFKTDTVKYPASTYEGNRNNGIADRLRATGVPLWGGLKTFVDKYTGPGGVGLTQADYYIISTWAKHCIIPSDDDHHSKVRKQFYEDFNLMELVIERSYSRTDNNHLTTYLTLMSNAKGN